MFLLRRRPTSTDPGTVADLTIQEQEGGSSARLDPKGDPSRWQLFDQERRARSGKELLAELDEGSLTVGGAVGIHGLRLRQLLSEDSSISQNPRWYYLESRLGVWNIVHISAEATSLLSMRPWIDLAQLHDRTKASS
jgi:hypothetical protein